MTESERQKDRAYKLRTISMPDDYWDRLKAIAVAMPGHGSASAAIRWLIDEETDRAKRGKAKVKIRD